MIHFNRTVSCLNHSGCLDLGFLRSHQLSCFLLIWAKVVSSRNNHSVYTISCCSRIISSIVNLNNCIFCGICGVCLFHAMYFGSKPRHFTFSIVRIPINGFPPYYAYVMKGLTIAAYIMCIVFSEGPISFQKISYVCRSVY